MRLVLRRNGEIVNVIEADLEWAQQNYPDCEITEEPLPEIVDTPAPQAQTHMTKYQFRRRFTLEELVKFDNPELFLPDMTPQQKAVAKTLMRSFDAALDIDLNDSQLQYGLQLMVDWGLLTEERKQQILDPSWQPPWAAAD